MNAENITRNLQVSRGHSLGSTVMRDLRKHRYVYIMLLPVVSYYLIFHYMPMYGAIIAFQNFRPFLGIAGSEWVGFGHFVEFFQSPYFVRLVRNTILISVYTLIFGFPAPIILAVLLNEVRSKVFGRTVQSLTYLPRFLSMVVITGMIIQFTSSTGFITSLVNLLVPVARGGLISDSGAFRAIYVTSGIWENIGWGSIIYLAGISSIDPELYEAAYIDGANRLRMIWHITIPGILPIIVIMLILRIGNLMSVGWMKILLLYSPLTYETADVISTYVFRKGITEMRFSFAAAVGLFNSVINLGLIMLANNFSRKVNENSLW